MYTIGELARQAGVKRQTIRYYEHIGLLAEPARTAGGQRRYGRKEAENLIFIRHCRAFGFPLDTVRILLKLRSHSAGQCQEAHHIVRRQLQNVERDIGNLTALRTELLQMISTCAATTAEECHVIEVLEDHSLCQAEHDHDYRVATR